MDRNVITDVVLSQVDPLLTVIAAGTRRCKLSTSILTLPARPACYAWQTTSRNSARLEGVWSMSRIQIDIWSQTCSIGFMSGLIVPPEEPSRPWWHVIPQNLHVVMPVHGSIQGDQVSPHALMDCTPHYGSRFPWVGRMHASTSLSPLALWPISSSKKSAYNPFGSHDVPAKTLHHRLPQTRRIN